MAAPEWSAASVKGGVNPPGKHHAVRFETDGAEAQLSPTTMLTEKIIVPGQFDA
jgi:hypothetical protein